MMMSLKLKFRSTYFATLTSPNDYIDKRSFDVLYYINCPLFQKKKSFFWKERKGVKVFLIFSFKLLKCLQCVYKWQFFLSWIIIINMFLTCLYFRGEKSPNVTTYTRLYSFGLVLREKRVMKKLTVPAILGVQMLS